MKDLFYWYENGEQKSGKKYPKGAEFQFIDGLFTLVGYSKPEEYKRPKGITESGRYVLLDGEFVKIGEARAIPDEPWCNKVIDWNKGVVNPTDGKTYGSKSQYLDAVKRSGGMVMGNDLKTEQRKETKGDFNVRKELTQATQQVLSKRKK